MESAEFHNSSKKPCTCTQCPKETEDLLLFMVPRAHCVATLNGYHRDAGHQECDHTLSLLQEHFWWPGMANQIWLSIKSCVCCLQHEGDLSKMPLHLIVATTLMDLLHVGFTSIEMTLELNRLPKVTNVLVFQDLFTKHIMTYVTPDQTAKAVTKFLYQGYILIFRAPARLLSNWVLTPWEASLMRCVNFLVWGNCGPCHTTPRHMGWWKITSNNYVNDQEVGRRQKRLTGQDIWLK